MGRRFEVGGWVLLAVSVAVIGAGVVMTQTAIHQWGFILFCGPTYRGAHFEVLMGPFSFGPATA
jgi:hypothetical protein